MTDNPISTGHASTPPASTRSTRTTNGHGTHGAGIIGATLNGLGTAGVAPKVTLVNIRGGQDSVVNMTFFTDPWLFDRTNNPADTPEQQQEQRTIREATQRALDFAGRACGRS